MNQAAVQRNLIPRHLNCIQGNPPGSSYKRSAQLKSRPPFDEVNGAVIDGVLAGENPATLYEEAFAGLVGVGGRAKGTASKDALKVVLGAIKENGSLADFDELAKLQLPRVTPWVKVSPVR